MAQPYGHLLRMEAVLKANDEVEAINLRKQEAQQKAETKARAEVENDGS